MSMLGNGHVEVVRLLLLLLLILIFNAEGNEYSRPPEGHGACWRLPMLLSSDYIELENHY